MRIKINEVNFAESFTGPSYVAYTRHGNKKKKKKEKHSRDLT